MTDSPPPYNITAAVLAMRKPKPKKRRWYHLPRSTSLVVIAACLYISWSEMRHMDEVIELNSIINQLYEILSTRSATPRSPNPYGTPTSPYVHALYR